MGLRLTEGAQPPDRSAFPALDHGSQPLRTPFKRAFDIIGACALLLLFSPFVLIASLAVRMQDGGQSIFWQPRRGLNNRSFNCFKIRSMVPDAKERLNELLLADPAARIEWDETQKLTNDPRITPVGHFMRKTSIDELPQLFNVIRGDMSLVGPRPIIDSEIPRYGDQYQIYTQVRPGITGLWQIKGRSNTTYAERVELDAEYVHTRTFWGDVKILLLTLPAILKMRGAR
jgi:lipopolysaccharide/colanic/teichoic acid biosynthesis glycosyltransferase